MAALVSNERFRTDVIVGPATPAGTSALAVVRLSGPAPDALEVARRAAPGLGPAPRPGVVKRTPLVDRDGRAMDDALVLYFAGPRSATGEDVIEFFCHGSPAVVAALLESTRKAGARAAAPGEFTRRALANGKVDLAAAEGIAQLAGAASRGAARRALGLVEGRLSARVQTLREELLDVLAALEAGLDFPEDVGSAAQVSLSGVTHGIQELLRLSHVSAAREHLPVVAIVGRPNAGKSALFNALVGSDRAIVTATPGTTRDAISETVEIASERVRLLDTAGLRETEEEVERAGVDAARRAASRAELVLYTLDGSRPATEEDERTLAALNGRHLLVLTKADLPRAARATADVVVSASTGAGLGELASLVVGRLRLGETEGELLILERHRSALERAAEAAARAATMEERGANEYVAAELRAALSCLGEITGETATEELLDKIFSTFCVGK